MFACLLACLWSLTVDFKGCIQTFDKGLQHQLERDQGRRLLKLKQTWQLTSAFYITSTTEHDWGLGLAMDIIIIHDHTSHLKHHSYMLFCCQSCLPRLDLC